MRVAHAAVAVKARAVLSPVLSSKSNPRAGRLGVLPIPYYTLQVTLITGEKRVLAGPSSPAKIGEAERALENAGEWIRTPQGTTIARAHIVEVAVVEWRPGDI
jgi:hypothetical protein